MAAAIGMATSAPTIPSSASPTSTASKGATAGGIACFVLPLHPQSWPLKYSPRYDYANRIGVEASTQQINKLEASSTSRSHQHSALSRLSNPSCGVLFATLFSQRVFGTHQRMRRCRRAVVHEQRHPRLTARDGVESPSASGQNLDHRVRRLRPNAASAALHLPQSFNVPCRRCLGACPQCSCRREDPADTDKAKTSFRRRDVQGVWAPTSPDRSIFHGGFSSPARGMAAVNRPRWRESTSERQRHEI